MPILPCINDTKQNVSELLQKAMDAGAQYVIPFFGVTFREGSREYFYKSLDKTFPDLRKQYESEFKDNYNCNSPQAKALYELFY